ncbi:MAG: hypothetical protein IH623_19460 [Verrucomicrobia bacterium]|nr:hypothetical protein [Verrucomicrobiota bacterium]
MAHETVILKHPVTSVDEVQKGWHELNLRVGQLEAERCALEQENKVLRALLERVIEHRQKSHSELVLLLSGLVSRLPINDVGLQVSRLVEHNAHVSEVCAALAKGKVETALSQPALLKALDQTKRELAAAVKPAVEAVIKLDVPLEKAMLESLITHPEEFFSPAVVRANRCFLKGQLPKERVLREFGEEALIFFNDLTTDPKLNPRPKPDEIVLAFKNDAEALFQQPSGLSADKRQALQALYEKVQRSKTNTEPARLQRIACFKLSFILELLHYYENQNTEAPDVIFAQRLPALVEQLVLTGDQDSLDEKLILQAEELLAFVISPDHRLMVVNNVGKGDGVARTLKYVLRLRIGKDLEHDQVVQNEVIPELVKHLIPTSPQKPPPPKTLAPLLQLIHPDLQRQIVRAIMACDRMRREDAQALGRKLGAELGLGKFEEELKTSATLSPEVERQLAWDKIKELIVRRADPAAVAAAIRDRLHAKYEAEEVKQSWITLIEADVISLIRIFCQLPYLANGKTDPIAQAVLETYVSRLMHEKYAAIYTKVVNSLRNMFKAKPDSPTLLNFVALVKWVAPEAASRLSHDIGMPLP